MQVRILVKRLFLLALIVMMGQAVFLTAAQDSVDVRRISVPGLLLGARLSPDGRTLAVYEISAVHNDYEVDAQYVPIRLIDLETGEQLLLDEQTDYPADIAFSADGAMVASSHPGGTISVWDVATGDEIKRMPAIVGVNQIAFLADGRTLAIGLPNLPATVALWDIESGMISHILTRRFDSFAEYSALLDPGAEGTLQFDRLTAFAVMPDGSGMISANQQDEILFWDLSRGDYRTLVAAKDSRPNISIRQITVTDDSSTLIYFHRRDQTVYFVDVASGSQSAAVPVNTVQEPAITSDGQTLAWIERDTGNLIVWRAAQPDSPITVALPDPAGVLENFRPARGGLYLTPDGKTAVLSGFTALDDGENEIWIVSLPE